MAKINKMKNFFLSLIKKNKFIFNNFKIVLLTAKGFKESNFNLWVSTLTYYTLLSVVPILAIIFAIGKGFGFKNVIEKQLLEKFSSNTEILHQIFDFANRLLDSTKGGLIAGIGIIVLFWSVIKVLINIEDSFNFIWKIKKSRHFIRRFSDYIALLFVLPILILISNSIKVYLDFKVEDFKNYIFLGETIFFILRMLPFLIMVVAFTIIYMVMPNTKVKITSALFSAIIVAMAYFTFQMVFLKSQIFLVKYNTIYGTFSAIPIFLMWIRFNWIIILFGTQVSFAIQNSSNYDILNSFENINIFNKKILMIYIMTYITKKFKDGETAPTYELIANDLEIPLEITLEIVSELIDVKLLSKILTDEYNEYGYQPNITIEKITIDYIINKFEKKEGSQIISQINMVKKENISLINKLDNLLSEGDYKIAIAKI